MIGILRFKITFAFLLISMRAFCSTLPSNIGLQKDSVKLIKWTAEDCDNTYNPYRLKNRITHIETRGTSTFITVNFSDNCCPVFQPAIFFNGSRLTLLPYEKYTGNYCSCNCCFSIQFEISGLAGKQYEVYFKDKKVELSGDYYDVVEPKDTLYDGKKINRINKYGFKEGLWITFYESGEKKSISQYPEDLQYFESYPLWSKGYYVSGKPSYSKTKDTSQSWFEDGEIKSQFIKYEIGDTTFEMVFIKFENRTLKKKYFKKSYPTVFKSKFDPAYESEGSVYETIYEEEYYENGQAKYLFGKDTSYRWFENGQIESKRYASGNIKYTENGLLKEKNYSWEEKGPTFWGDLPSFLNVEFYPNGNIKEIQLCRDEVFDNGKSLSRVRYYWKWNAEKTLTESPKKWKGEYPWKKFPEINVPPIVK